ncbi:MAG: hypothetical protein PWQ25_1885 [Deferribacteres bacterium]|jgi:ferredoxin|nr:hypothetical protein [Deferribacteraceae bacterium]MDK2793022.1 hypothetical protein [Deferribacteres bacterium]
MADYKLKVPNNLLLISDNTKKLRKYEEILGGIYNIYTIFYSDIFSKEFFASKNIKISGRFPAFNVNFEFLDVIKFDICSYCGKCYKECPEKCISVNLDINFDKCTLCEKCEIVCPEKCIGLRSLKTSEITTAFILTDIDELIDNYKLPGIYKFEDYENVLSLTGEFLISESISHNDNICQYSGKRDFGCKRCIDSCERYALYVEDKKIKIDHLLCVSCGKCVSVCPTGAMQSMTVSDVDFIDSFKENNFKNKVVVLGNHEEIRGFKWKIDDEYTYNYQFIESEPKYFNLLNYLFLFSCGASKLIILDERLCNSNQILFANRLIEYLFNYSDFIVFRDDGYYGPNPLSEFYADYSFDTRRKKLASIIGFLFEKSPVRKVLIDEEYLNIFGEVELDELKCSLCLACVNHCKIGALSANQMNYSLNHNPSYCIQCGICEDVCPENAIKIRKGLLLSEEFFENKELFRDEPIVCPECKKEFASKKAFETVKRKLIKSGYFESKGKYLNYCEECRVIKILELNA